jgi:hypothetical protein
LGLHSTQHVAQNRVVRTNLLAFIHNHVRELHLQQQQICWLLDRCMMPGRAYCLHQRGLRVLTSILGGRRWRQLVGSAIQCFLDCFAGLIVRACVVMCNLLLKVPHQWCWAYVMCA